MRSLGYGLCVLLLWPTAIGLLNGARISYDIEDQDFFGNILLFAATAGMHALATLFLRHFRRRHNEWYARFGVAMEFGVAVTGALGVAGVMMLLLMGWLLVTFNTLEVDPQLLREFLRTVLIVSLVGMLLVRPRGLP